MPPAYFAKGDQTLTTTFTTALTVGSNATTAQRNQFFRFILSLGLTPSDSQITWEIQRCSALGTSTAVTPGQGDGAERAAQAAVGENHTVEPTYTADAFLLEEFALNARASFVLPGFPGEIWTHAATVGAGIGVKALHVSRTEDFLAHASWFE
jgi:hypothetical protein